MSSPPVSMISTKRGRTPTKEHSSPIRPSPAKNGSFPASPIGTFSPIKLPVSISSPITGRRNTIHLYSQRKVETPLNSDDPKLPITSPRLHVNKRARFDRRLISGDEKENKIPFDSSPLRDIPVGEKEISTSEENALRKPSSVIISSPLKRSPLRKSPLKGDVSEKISKTITNANDHVPVDEVFYKEDLIAQVESSLDKRDVVIDNDSSDPEDYGRIENSISQTILPHTGVISVKQVDITVNQKIDTLVTPLSKRESYVTPQRPTEPDARSPATKQLDRIKESIDFDEEDYKVDKDSTSPLKGHVRKREDETRFYAINEEEDLSESIQLSPNSKPIYSINQVHDFENDLKARLDEYRTLLEEKDSRLLDLRHEVDLISNELIKEKLENQKIRDANNSLAKNEQALTIQLKGGQLELIALEKLLRQKNGTIRSLEKYKQELESVLQKYLSEVELLSEANVDLEQRILKETERTLMEAERFSTQTEMLVEERNTLSEKYNQTATKNTQISEENKTLLEEIKKLTSSDQQNRDKLEELQRLILQVEGINDMLESNLKTVQESSSSKVRSLQDSFNDEISQYNTEAEQLKSTIHNLEIDITHLKLEKESQSDLKEDLQLVENTNKKLHLKIDALESELQVSREEADNHISEYIEETNKKDEIISHDAQKMKELMAVIETVSKKHAIEIEDFTNEIYSLQKEVKHLTREASLIKEKEEISMNNRLNNASEYLHKQYADKHQRRMAEALAKHRKEMTALEGNNKEAQREVDLLRRKLDHAQQEVKRMSEIAHSRNWQEDYR